MQTSMMIRTPLMLMPMVVVTRSEMISWGMQPSSTPSITINNNREVSICFSIPALRTNSRKALGLEEAISG